MLAAACGCILASIITFVFFFTFIGGIMSMGSVKPVPANGILRIDMSQFAVVERVKSSDLQSALQGGFIPSCSLLDITKAIKTAAQDPNVHFIFLKSDGLSAGIAQVEELRAALAEFRRSGKAVVAFGEFPSLGAYYLSSVADKVYLSANTGAGPQISGVATQMIFIGDLLKNLGVNAQLIRHGKYKSAGEMFIKGEPSKENLEQTEEMVRSIWASLAEEISASRGIPADKLEELVDNLKLNTCKDMVDYGLADELLLREDLKEKLAMLDGKTSYKDVQIIDLPDYITLHKRIIPEFAKNQIAVVMAEGEIVEGIDDMNIAGDRFASILAKIRNNDNIKAVVLRVSSPGGSVLASDKIRSEIEMLRRSKPVIASYGDYAASGGYWISSSCDYIFSDKTTLTGSIGVFAMVPDFSKTLKEKLHVNVVTVASSKHAANIFKPLDEVETASIQKSIDEVYNQFVAHVAEGRDLEPSYVDDIAQGRVWTGADALGIRLVDQIGSLNDAIQYAAIAAGDADVSHWKVRPYGEVEPSLLDQILSSAGVPSDQTDVLAYEALTPVMAALKQWQASSKERFFARMPYQMVLSH